MPLKRNKFRSAEQKLYHRLSTPAKLQDFLNRLPVNFEATGVTCMSPRQVLQTKKAHCLEGALLAACALQFHGHQPLLLDLRPLQPDEVHVVALFKIKGYWGGISKTNHAVLRFREPVYKTIRELVMSYFHEYFLDNGEKMLRDYAGPINLSRFDNLNWQTADSDVWYIDKYLNRIKHYKILELWQERQLRKADDIEIAAGKLIEWKSNSAINARARHVPGNRRRF
jgi:hypothetical protein